MDLRKHGVTIATLAIASVSALAGVGSYVKADEAIKRADLATQRAEEVQAAAERRERQLEAGNAVAMRRNNGWVVANSSSAPVLHVVLGGVTDERSVLLGDLPRCQQFVLTDDDFKRAGLKQDKRPEIRFSTSVGERVSHNGRRPEVGADADEELVLSSRTTEPIPGC